MSLQFGDYATGGTSDSQSFASQVYGGPGQQHSIGTIHGGNEDNVILSKPISNCSVGGRKRHRRTRRRTKKSKQSRGGKSLKRRRRRH